MAVGYYTRQEAGVGSGAADPSYRFSHTLARGDQVTVDRVPTGWRIWLQHSLDYHWGQCVVFHSDGSVTEEMHQPGKAMEVHTLRESER